MAAKREGRVQRSCAMHMTRWTLDTCQLLFAATYPCMRQNISLICIHSCKWHYGSNKLRMRIINWIEKQAWIDTNTTPQVSINNKWGYPCHFTLTHLFSTLEFGRICFWWARRESTRTPPKSILSSLSTKQPKILFSLYYFPFSQKSLNTNTP